MPKMILSIDNVVIREVQLTKERTTFGRRPYNDIVIDNLAVSGEHAAVLITETEVAIEDLNSTNGTYVNGKPVKRQALQHGDLIDLGKYQLRFLSEVASGSAPAVPAATSAPSAASHEPSHTTYGELETQAAHGLSATVRVLTGAAAGRELPLTKVVTTVGKPGVAVAAITRRQNGYVLHHVEGAGDPALNGVPFGAEPQALRDGDVIELAGTRMKFVLH
jgi:FHA domain